MNRRLSLSSTDQETVSVSIDELTVGAVCQSSIEDETGRLLLGAGTRITADLIQGMRDRGIEELAINAADLAALRGNSPSGGRKLRPARNKSDKPNSQIGKHPSEWKKGVPLRDALVDRYEEPLDPARREVVQGHVKLAHNQFEEIRQEISGKKLETVQALSDLSSAFASAMVDDHDQTLGEVVRSHTTCSLTDRSVKLALLGMAVATEMGLDGPSVLDVGTAGLLHDMGLYLMEPSLIAPGRGPLSDEENWQYRKHPLVSSNALREVSDVPHGVLTAIEQVHEQYNGSGYPFGLEGKRSSVYARVLNVCDTYIRLTSGTSFRRAMVPHDAIGLILHQARFLVFDPTVIHAFLRTESLFPLGSQVQMNDGQTANVIRRPRYGYAHPVLQLQDGSRLELESRPEESLKPICDPNCNQARLPIAEMEKIRWTPGDELLLGGAFEVPTSEYACI